MTATSFDLSAIKSDVLSAASTFRTLIGLGSSAILNAGSANGVATLGADSKLTAAQIPDISLISYLGSVASQAAMLALTGQQGDWCVRSDLSTTWVITGSDPTLLANWTQLSYPSVPVQSVFGRTGAVVGVSTDYSSVGITNTAIGATNPSTGAFTTLSANSATFSAGILNGTVLDITQTWGGTGTYTGIRYNVTDSGPSNAASLLMDLQVGGVSKFKVSKNGSLVLTEALSTVATANGALKFGSNFYSIAVDGTDVFCFGGRDAALNPITGAIVRSTSVIGFSSGSPLYGTVADLTLYRDAANTLAQRNGTSAQALRLYKTWANNGVDYERAVLDWQTTSDVFRIGTEAGGTGTVRNIALVGGNVGIGTTGPSAKLAVIKDYTWGASIPTTGQGQPGIGVAGRFNVINNNRTFYFDVVSSPTVYAEFSTYEYGTNVPFAMVFQGNGGNVGISNLSPAAKLDILDTTGAGSGSLQASALNIAQTWNTTGTPTAFKLNVTDTASNAASLFAAFQFAGVSRYEFAKTAFRLYNTNDASTANYERAKIAWSSNVLQIGTEKLGTGAARAFELQTDGTTRLSIAATGAVTLTSSLSATNNGINISNVGGNGFNTSSGGYIIFKSSGVLTLSNALDNDWGRLQFGGTTSSFPAIKRNSAALNFRLADDSGDCDITAKAATFSGNVTVSAVNLVTDTTTGTKIGTGTTQKLGFYNATPVVQPAAVADATDAASVITQLNLLLARMRDLGLIAT